MQNFVSYQMCTASFDEKKSAHIDNELVEAFSKPDAQDSFRGERRVGSEGGEGLQQPLPVTLLLAKHTHISRKLK